MEASRFDFGSILQGLDGIWGRFGKGLGGCFRGFRVILGYSGLFWILGTLLDDLGGILADAGCSFAFFCVLLLIFASFCLLVLECMACVCTTKCGTHFEFKLQLALLLASFSFFAFFALLCLGLPGFTFLCLALPCFALLYSCAFRSIATQVLGESREGDGGERAQ